jgi:hypothetical protein
MPGINLSGRTIFLVVLDDECFVLFIEETGLGPDISVHTSWMVSVKELRVHIISESFHNLIVVVTGLGFLKDVLQERITASIYKFSSLTSVKVDTSSSSMSDSSH